MDYANRDNEYSIICDYLEKGLNPILINAFQASGITSFTKIKLYNECYRLFGERIYYIDLASNNVLNEAFLSVIIHSELFEDLQELVNKKYGTHEKGIIASILESVPYGGPFLGRLSSKKTALPVYSGAYPSAVEEMIIQLFQTNNCYKHLVIIDSIELLSEQSFDLFVCLLKCPAIQFLLIKTSNDVQFDKLENYLFDNNIFLQHTVEFTRPSLELVFKIAKLYSIDLDYTEAKTILECSHYNIHSIIQQIRRAGKCSPDHVFSAAEETMVHLLSIINEPVNENTLYQVFKLTNVVSFHLEQDFKTALYSLQYNRIAACLNENWSLLSHNNPEINSVLNNYADHLIYMNCVYNYLQSHSIGENSSRLRYNLSKQLDCTTESDSRALLGDLFVQGKEIPRELLADSNLRHDNENDCLIASIIYCRSKEFSKSLEWIESIPVSKRNHEENCFHAILLNRIRRSKDAEAEIISCIRDNSDKGIENLLYAYLISTYIHLEDLPKAQSVFSANRINSKTPFYGYFVRNATSAFSGFDRELYIEALQAFEQDSDDFGYSTTLCNYGYALIKNGYVKEALPILLEAKSHLELYPKNNLYILYNDLGICYFLMEQYRKAIDYFQLSIRIGKNSVPIIFSKINLACVLALKGEKDSAVQIIRSMETEVNEHALDRVRQQYYINRILVEYLSGNMKIDNLISQSKRYLDRYHPDKTLIALEKYQKMRAIKKPFDRRRWKNFYFPCGLVYWYVDPLKLFSHITV